MKGFYYFVILTILKGFVIFEMLQEK